jgi:uncharacterized protein YndB with AHSA1/START domain
MAQQTTSGAEHRLEVRRIFDAPRERVFRAWTEAEALKRWFAPENVSVVLSEADVVVGGEYRVHMQAPDKLHQVRGRYREVDPPRRLVFTWQWETNADEHETLVTVEFEDRGDQTEVVLRHDGFRNDEERAGHAQGWDGVLAKLVDELKREN